MPCRLLYSPRHGNPSFSKNTIFKERDMDQDKKSYMQQLADKIVEWDKKINDLKKQGGEAATIMKEDYTKISADLKVKKKEAEEKLKQLKSVSGEGWEEMKKGAEQAVNDLSQAFSKAMSKMKQK
jgi:hypothetical protein